MIFVVVVVVVVVVSVYQFVRRFFDVVAIFVVVVVVGFCHECFVIVDGSCQGIIVRVKAEGNRGDSDEGLEGVEVRMGAARLLSSDYIS